MFKVSKDLLKLGKEFKIVNFDMMISHISIVFTRYMVLEYLKRANNDFRYPTTNLWYYKIFDEVSDAKLLPALNALIILFDDIIKQYVFKNELIKSQVYNIISLFPCNLKDLFPVYMWESWVTFFISEDILSWDYKEDVFDEFMDSAIKIESYMDELLN